MVRINFFKCHIGDVDDVEIYASQPIYEWAQTDQGTWVKERCNDLVWYTKPNEQMGWTITVRGSLTDKDATEYYLKWPSN